MTEHIPNRTLVTTLLTVPALPHQEKTDLVSGPVKVGIQSTLPFDGVHLILGNDLAGDKVVVNAIDTEKPGSEKSLDPVEKIIPGLYPACVAAFCVIFLVLFVQGENENEISDTDVELQEHNLREKRSTWWRRRHTPRSRRFLTRRFSRYRRPSYRYRYRPRPRYCPSYKILLRIVLKNVDCLNNTKCRSKQKLLFGTPTPSPSSSPVMSLTPSSSQVASTIPAVSPALSTSPAMSVTPSHSQVVSSMPAVSASPSSGSAMVSQTVSQVNI
ncbi:uncharacterized protein LOC111326297 [Stylophora pistillata]|uniref:uncharacterized protein LOC111326297 n=1 Tax=Stylophora pistillata TaxID=50429 RepID=UPI000C0436E2|nr:uncharacterized protein LOC111326297 [Stylophora pistillata]